MPIGPRRVVITARNLNGDVVQELDLSAAEWYDGEVPLIDDDNECRRLAIRTVEGFQTDRYCKIYKRWKIILDAEGRTQETEEWDDWQPKTYNT